MLLKIEKGNGNPTQLLMDGIQRKYPAVAINKDEEFYLAFLESGVSALKAGRD